MRKKGQKLLPYNTRWKKRTILAVCFQLQLYLLVLGFKYLLNDEIPFANLFVDNLSVFRVQQKIKPKPDKSWYAAYRQMETIDRYPYGKTA